MYIPLLVVTFRTGRWSIPACHVDLVCIVEVVTASIRDMFSCDSATDGKYHTSAFSLTSQSLRQTTRLDKTGTDAIANFRLKHNSIARAATTDCKQMMDRWLAWLIDKTFWLWEQENSRSTYFPLNKYTSSTNKFEAISQWCYIPYLHRGFDGE